MYWWSKTFYALRDQINAKNPKLLAFALRNMDGIQGKEGWRW